MSREHGLPPAWDRLATASSDTNAKSPKWHILCGERIATWWRVGYAGFLPHGWVVTHLLRCGLLIGTHDLVEA